MDLATARRIHGPLIHVGVPPSLRFAGALPRLNEPRGMVVESPSAASHFDFAQGSAEVLRVQQTVLSHAM
eukprot:3171960-Pyramimonas_sp.AAC.1